MSGFQSRAVDSVCLWTAPIRPATVEPTGCHCRFCCSDAYRRCCDGVSRICCGGSPPADVAVRSTECAAGRFGGRGWFSLLAPVFPGHRAGRLRLVADVECRSEVLGSASSAGGFQYAVVHESPLPVSVTAGDRVSDGLVTFVRSSAFLGAATALVWRTGGGAVSAAADGELSVVRTDGKVASSVR